MARAWVLTAVFLSLVPAPWAGAAPKGGPKDARREDASRLLTEALRTGKADGEAIATIVRWVLEEKEDTVARGFSDALAAVASPSGDGGVWGGRIPPDSKGAADSLRRADEEQWNATSRAIVALFGTVLKDAENLHRRDAASLHREMSAVVDAATPALAAALREADPAGRELLIRGLQALAAAAPDAGVREGATRALKHIDSE